MNRTLLDDRRVIVGGTAALALVLVALAWFLAVGPQLAKADDLALQQTDAEMQNAALQTKNAGLERQQQKIGELESAFDAARAGLPTTTAFPEFTRQVSSGAAKAGVSLDNVSISDPQAVVTDAAATAKKAAPATQQSIEVSLTTTGTLKEQSSFLRGLQDGDRRALITSSQVSVDGESRTASVDAATSMTTEITLFTGS